MNNITNAETKSLRDEISSTILSQDAELLTYSEVIDEDTGTRSEVYTPTEVKCRVTPLSKPLINLYQDQLMGSVGYMIMLPYDTTVTSLDKISVSGKTYQVIGSYTSHPSVVLKIVTKILE